MPHNFPDNLKTFLRNLLRSIEVPGSTGLANFQQVTPYYIVVLLLRCGRKMTRYFYLLQNLYAI